MQATVIAHPISRLVTALFAVTCAGTAFSEEAAQWLQRAANAARTLNYSGIVVYQQGHRVETSRLIHYVDAGSEQEKLISLDGPAREVIRIDDQITCYYSDIKTIRVEDRANRRVFPSLLPNQIAALLQHYHVQRAEIDRVAGMDVQAYVFRPKDDLRYGHKFWSDLASGLLLKARMLNEKNDVVEQFAFTTIQIGGKIDKEMVKPSYPTRPADWQLQQSTAQDKAEQKTGWVVRRVPPGFNKVKEIFRRIGGKEEPVAHLVFSDGLVAVSIFIEPVNTTPRQLGLSQQGAINIFSRQLDNYLITALGETPGATVRQMAVSVARR